ncbi:LLM class F420-dependent oxidoreductase [Spelaeicoccus albus]|nr:LLM class F420-dependent oxidoreductase [Spelaeicoccus albus]
MRFGLFLPQGWRIDLAGIDPVDHWRTIMRVAAHADETEEWTSAWVFDHFHTVPVPTTEATHEAYSLLAGVAASTQRIRLGQMCTCVSYRNPAYLAKTAATIDVISGGRMEMGLGAGWYENEWRAYGYGFPRAGERLARLDEGAQILRQMWVTGESTFSGKHFRTSGAKCAPQPLQHGGIPLWIAGGGEKRTLQIAAMHADYSNFDGPLDVFVRKSGILDEHCRDLGRDPAEIGRSANFTVLIGEDEKDVQDKIDWLTAHVVKFLGPEHAGQAERWTRHRTAIGTPEQIIERLGAVRDAGLDYGIMFFPDMAYDLSSIELFERQVIPALT